tara:strand:- start:215 stop:586 length:372 start_codon:yes stop_codon:yes gene_type:complete
VGWQVAVDHATGPAGGYVVGHVRSDPPLSGFDQDAVQDLLSTLGDLVEWQGGAVTGESGEELLADCAGQGGDRVQRAFSRIALPGMEMVYPLILYQVPDLCSADSRGIAVDRAERPACGLRED